MTQAATITKKYLLQLGQFSFVIVKLFNQKLASGVLL